MRPLPITDDLWLCEQSVYLPGERTLVVADLQLGQEQQLRSLGHNVMYEQGRKMFRLLLKLIRETSARRLVIDGDVKHEFGRITSQERTDVLGMLRELGKRVEVVLVKGNHDTVMRPLADELSIPLLDAWRSGPFLCVHGHELPDVPESTRTIIIGHMHPAIALYDGIRRERFKCFLIGTYKRKRLVVLPSLSTMTEGVDVLTSTGNSPLLPSLERCEVYVIADEIREFGDVSNLRVFLSDTKR